MEQHTRFVILGQHENVPLIENFDFSRDFAGLYKKILGCPHDAPLVRFDDFNGRDFPMVYGKATHGLWVYAG